VLLRRTAIPTFYKYHKLYSVDSATDERMDDPWESFQMGSAVLNSLDFREQWNRSCTAVWLVAFETQFPAHRGRSV